MFLNTTKNNIIMDTENKIITKEEIFKDLKHKHYGIYGNHSAVEICSWNKKALIGEGVCYKEKFYNVDCHRCAQITPTAIVCHLNCSFCWRPTAYMKDWAMTGTIDEPDDIIEGLFKERKKLLTGFKGNDKVDIKKYEEAIVPSHVAISLSGEPTIYPKLAEMVLYLKKKKEMRSIFIVTNGMEPDRLEELQNKNALPTQLYLSIIGATKEMQLKINRPKIEDSWERLNKTIDLYPSLNCRRIIRFTLIKGLNDSKEAIEKFIKMFERSNTDFLEIKSYMHLGASRDNLTRENMPTHKEVLDYSQEIEKNSKLFKIHNEQKESKIVLLKNINSKYKDFIK
jgi:tRNA wybutosine-synthesizing protein 1